MIVCHCDVIDDRKVIAHLKECGPAADEKAMKKIRGDLHRKHTQSFYPKGNRCADCTNTMAECIFKHSRTLLEATA